MIKKIEITERWSVHHDGYQWVLTESYQGKDRKGNSKAQTKETYHPWLEQALRWAAERDCRNADTFKDIQKAYMGLVHALADCTRPIDKRVVQLWADLRDTKHRLSDALSENRKLRRKCGSSKEEPCT